MTEQDRELRTADSMAEGAHSGTETEINLLELLYRLLEKWVFIAAIAFLCMLVAGFYSFFIAKPQYSATAKLYVVNSKDSALNLSDLQIGSFLTSDYQEVFKTWEVHEMVIQDLGLAYTYEEMEDMLSIQNPSGTRILNITVTSLDPDEATAIANSYAKVSKMHISRTMATDEPNVLSVALRPVYPVSPNKTRNVLLGFILGALLAIGIVTLRFVLDDKIRTSEDIMRYAELPTLAVVPLLDSNSTFANKKPKTKA